MNSNVELNYYNFCIQLVKLHTKIPVCNTVNNLWINSESYVEKMCIDKKI